MSDSEYFVQVLSVGRLDPTEHATPSSAERRMDRCRLRILIFKTPRRPQWRRSMVRRFTILDHLTPPDGVAPFQDDVTPLGLSDFLKEIEHHASATSAPAETPIAPIIAPKPDDHSTPSADSPSSDEDDMIDQDELYYRILLQHPDLLAPPPSDQSLVKPDTPTTHPDMNPQPVDTTDHSDDHVIVITSPRSKVGHRSQRPDTTCTLAAPPKPVKDKHRHELDPALADVLRRHKELQMKRTTIMTHPAIQKQLKSFWSLCVKPTAADGTGGGLARDGYNHFYATLLGGLTTDWDAGLGAAILHRGWEFDRRGMQLMDMSCFCASLYFFVEHWVHDTTLAEYQRVLKRLREILQAASAPGQRHDHETNVEPSQPHVSASPVTDMTLMEFNQKLLLQDEQKTLQVLLGKSIDFDATAYLQYFVQQQQRRPSTTTHPSRHHATVLCAGDAKFEGLRPIQSGAQIQINVKEKVRPATGGATRRDVAPDIKKPMPALSRDRPLVHPKSAGKDKPRPAHPLPHL